MLLQRPGGYINHITMNNRISSLLLIVTVLFTCATASAQQAKPLPFSASIERLFQKVQSDIVTTANAMPEERFNFTPDSLHIPGAAFDTVRSFAGQIMHLAT